MTKKRYKSPILMDLTPDDPDFPIGGSQGGSGDVSMFSFEDDELKELLEGLGFDYFEFEQIDGYLDPADTDGEITWAEYNAWAADNGD